LDTSWKDLPGSSTTAQLIVALVLAVGWLFAGLTISFGRRAMRQKELHLTKGRHLSGRSAQFLGWLFIVFGIAQVIIWFCLVMLAV
jgi:hypothetical protein